MTAKKNTNVKPTASGKGKRKASGKDETTTKNYNRTGKY